MSEQSQVEMAGYYGAIIRDSHLQEENSGAVTFVARLELSAIQHERDGEYERLPEHKFITAFLNVMKIDGGKNKSQVKALCGALEWDGASLYSLRSTDWNGTKVQAVVEEQEYEGKASLRVSWLNSVDHSAGATPMTGDRAAELDGRWQGKSGPAESRRRPSADELPPDNELPF